MSVIYYCDAPSCGKKQAGVAGELPKNWVHLIVEGKPYDACSAQHEAAIIETYTPPEPEEEEAESEA
jgi:hypothetical protein